MAFAPGTRVEVAGDASDEGWRGSWWTAVVAPAQGKKKEVTVVYDELLEDDGKTKLKESVAAARVRPRCYDDCEGKPLHKRTPGEPVDCWHDDGWWEGYVHRVYDDHITVFFPLTGEEYDDIYLPAHPPDPAKHRVRSGMAWDAAAQEYMPRPHKAYAGSGDFRTKAKAKAAPGKTAAAPQAAGRPAAAAAAAGAKAAGKAPAKAALQPTSASSTSSDEDMPLSARKTAAPAAKKAAVAKQALLPAKKAVPPAKQVALGSSSEDDPPLFARRPTVKLPPPPGLQPKQQQQQQAQQQQQQQQQQPKPQVKLPQPPQPKQGLRAAVAAGTAPAAPMPPGPAKQPGAVPKAVEAVVVSLLSDSEDQVPAAVAVPAAVPAAAKAAAPAPAAAKAPAAVPPAAKAPAAPPAAAKAAAAAPPAAAKAPAAPPAAAKAAAPPPTTAATTTAAAAPAAPPAVAKPAAAPPAMEKQARQQAEPEQPPSKRQKQQGEPPQLAKQPSDVQRQRAQEAPPAAQRAQDVQQAQQAQQGEGSWSHLDIRLAPPPKRPNPAQAAAAVPSFLDLKLQASKPKPRQEAAAVQHPPLQRTGSKLGSFKASNKPGAAVASSKTRAAVGGAGGTAKSAAGGKAGLSIPKRPLAPFIPKRQLAGAEAAAPSPRGPQSARHQYGGSGAGAAAEAQQPTGPLDYDPDFLTTFCLDNLPASITTPVLREGLEGIGFTGLAEVEVVSVPLDVGERHAGYAVLRFASAAHAHRQWSRLKSLCLVTPTCPIPRPLIPRRPRVSDGYAWGWDARLPGHFDLGFRPNQHFAQPNAIEFDLAIEWRQLLAQLAHAKSALCLEQAEGLATQMAAYAGKTGCPAAALDRERLRLPGEGGRRRGGSPPPTPTCCIWLSGVLAAAGEKDLVDAFSQFGYPQKAMLVLDPVTRLPSSHAVLWMESEQRARDLVQNLREMVYVLNGSPRAVDATLAVPGPARGSQSVYDRALRCVYGTDDSALSGDVSFLEVPDALLLQEGGPQPSHEAAIALRRLLAAYTKEQNEMWLEKQERMRALDHHHHQHFAAEQHKLARLALLEQQQERMPSGDRAYLMDHLKQQHRLHVKVYHTKQAQDLARMALRAQHAQQ